MIYIPYGRRGSIKNFLGDIHQYCVARSKWSSRLCKPSPLVSQVRLHQSRCKKYTRPYIRGEIHISGHEIEYPSPLSQALILEWKRLNYSSIRPWDQHHMYPHEPSVLIQFGIKETSLWVPQVAGFINWVENVTRDDGLILDVSSCIAVADSASRPVDVNLGVVCIPYSSGYYADHQKIVELIDYHWEIDKSRHKAISAVDIKVPD